MGEAAQIAKKGQISKFRKWINDERVFAYVLNIPSIFIILLLVAYSIIYSFILSLYKYNLKTLPAHPF